MISLNEVKLARGRIAPHLRPTPVTLDRNLNLWLKSILLRKPNLLLIPITKSMILGSPYQKLMKLN